MRSKLRFGKLPLLAAFVGGLVVSQIASPAYRQLIMWLAYDSYATLVFECDNAMRDHLLAKQRVGREPSLNNVSALEAAEVGLLDCQDYDRMRKRLIFWGLSANELALMGLDAIEEKASSLHQVIEIHEIRY